MRRDRLRQRIEECLTHKRVIDDHGTPTKRRMAFTLTALTQLATYNRPMKREVLEALTGMIASGKVTTRRHKPSGQLLYKWASESDRKWREVNGPWRGALLLHNPRYTEHTILRLAQN